MEYKKQLAAVALFRELYNSAKNVYDVLGLFIIHVVRKNGHLITSSEDIRRLLLTDFDFELPVAVIEYVLRKNKISYEKGFYKFTSNGEDGFDESLAQLDEEYEAVLSRLCDHISQEQNAPLNTGDKAAIIRAFCAFILDESVDNRYSSYIGKFIVANQQNGELNSVLNRIREGVVLYTGLRYSSDDLGQYGWKQEMVIYLDTEIIFYAMGYSGEIYKAQFEDFLQLVNEINKGKQRPIIKLRYFEPTKDEILRYFEKAERIVVGKDISIPGKVAMQNILFGKQRPAEIREEHARLVRYLESIGVTLDNRDDYYFNKNEQYNIESQAVLDYCKEKYSRTNTMDTLADYIATDLRQLNYINILREGDNTRGIDKTKYLLLTGSSTVLNMGKDEKVKSGNTSLAFSLSYLINRFWFKQNKGFGRDTQFPTSLKVIRQAQIVLANCINNSLIADYAKLKNDSTRSRDDIIAGYAELRNHTVVPEEIDSANVNEKLDFIDSDAVDRVIQEREHLRLKAETAEQQKQEQENLVAEKEEQIKRLQGEIQESEQEKERRQYLVEQKSEEISKLQERILKMEVYRNEQQKKEVIEEENRQKRYKERIKKMTWFIIGTIILIFLITAVLGFIFNDMLVGFGGGAITVLCLLGTCATKTQKIAELLARRLIRKPE